MIIFSILVFILPAFSSSNTPYEQCTWKNKEFTQEMLQNISKSSPNTEGGAPCLDCLSTKQDSSIKDSSIKNMESANNHISIIPDICFYASMLKSKQPGFYNYFYCHNGKAPRTMAFHSCQETNNKGKGIDCKLGPGSGVTRNLYRRRYCLSQDYVQTTSQSFNEVADCFDLSPADKLELFAMFNHESSFMLNAKSPTGARCYGQVTEDVLHTINRYIFYRGYVKSWRTQWGIYQDVIEKKQCSFLQNKTIKMPFEDKHRQKKLGSGGYDKNFRNDFKSNSSKFNCEVTQDPYSCFFYSIYNYKLNKYAFENVYRTIPPDSGLSQDVKEVFQLPISFNEILHLKGKITIRGQVKEVDWLIKDISELKGLLSKGMGYNTEDLKIKKINVFPENILEKDVTQRSYNGGISIINRHLPDFMEELKTAISSKNCVRDDICKSHRKRIKMGKSLSSQNLNYLFKRYLKAKKKKGEPDEYIEGIERDLCYLQNKGNQRGQIQTKLENVNHSLSNQKIDEFISQVRVSCPGNDLIKNQCNTL